MMICSRRLGFHRQQLDLLPLELVRVQLLVTWEDELLDRIERPDKARQEQLVGGREPAVADQVLPVQVVVGLAHWGPATRRPSASHRPTSSRRAVAARSSLIG